jgi:hypothetical protein
MEAEKEQQKRVNTKGKRLNWTPIDKAERVSLKKMNVSGYKVPSDIIRERKKYIGSNKHLLIP